MYIQRRLDKLRPVNLLALSTSHGTPKLDLPLFYLQYREFFISTQSIFTSAQTYSAFMPLARAQNTGILQVVFQLTHQNGEQQQKVQQCWYRKHKS